MDQPQEPEQNKNLRISVYYCGTKPTNEELSAFSKTVISTDAAAAGYSAVVALTIDISDKFVITEDIESDVKQNCAALKEIIAPGAFFLNPSPPIVEIVKLMKLEEGTGALRAAYGKDGKFVRWTVVW